MVAFRCLAAALLLATSLQHVDSFFGSGGNVTVMTTVSKYEVSRISIIIIILSSVSK